MPGLGLEEPPYDVSEAGRLDLGRILDDLYAHTAANLRTDILSASVPEPHRNPWSQLGQAAR
jgi:hypothetical protein